MIFLDEYTMPRRGITWGVENHAYSVVGCDVVWNLTPHGVPNLTLKSLLVRANN